MVRSNFDYTNRTSSGEKLGASIASDFWKKAAQIVKPTKAAIRSSKQTPKAKLTQSNTPSPVKSVTQTKLDIKIPDKTLTDAGFEPIAEALVAALKARPDLILTELNLSGNDLTCRSLLGLAHIVQHSPDLAVLNLSNNRVSIKTQEEVGIWEDFASAYWSCPSMTLLDLSRNHDLGGLAFETLARTAVMKAVDVPDRRDSHQGSETDSPTGTEDGLAMGSSHLPSKRTYREPNKVITAKDVGLDEHGVLFASAVMMRKAILTGTVKIEWSEKTDLLTRDGALLMDLCVKYQNVQESIRKIETCPDSFPQEQVGAILTDGHTHLSRDSLTPTYELGDLDVNESVLLADIDRATKKIQRSVIVRCGHVSVELWTAAMQVFTISRKLYILAVSIGHGTGKKPGLPYRTDNGPETSRSLCFLEREDVDWSGKVVQQTKLWEDVSPRSIPGGKPKAVIVKGSTNSAREAIPRGVMEQGFKRLEDGIVRRDANGRLPWFSDSRAKIFRPGSPQSRNETPAPHCTTDRTQTYLDWQVKRLKSLHDAHGGASDGYRDTSLKCQLPLTVCNLILHSAADERSLAVLSRRQQMKAFEWGQLHDSLKTENDWRNRDQASQIWMLLETLECLEYDYEH